MENIEQLKKLAKVFNSDNVITSVEIEQVLKGIMTIMSSFKKDNETLNSDTKKQVSNLIQQVVSEHERIVFEVSNITDKQSKQVLKDLDSKMKEIKSIVDDFKALEIKDGKDADEEYIINEVLTRIELPQYKETILDDGSQIKDKLESLKGEDRLDISAVKGSDKLTTQANLDRAVSILDQRTQFLINKTNSSSYTLPIASGSTLGGIKVGSGLSIDGSGVLSASGGGSGITLKTNGTDNGSQSILNLKQGTNVTLADDGVGGVTINATGGGGSGDVVGPAGATDGYVAFFDGTTGKIIKDIGITLSGSNTGDQDLSGYELLSNKDTSTSLGTSDTLYPTQNAVKTYADSLVAGLLDYRGGYDASVNTFPVAGGSGTAGAVLKGDMWVVSVAGTLGGNAVAVGDSIIANVDTPGQTAANWNTLNTNITYVPEDVANKVTSISGASTDTQYPSAKLVYDQLALKINTSAIGSTVQGYDANTTILGNTTTGTGSIVLSGSPALTTPSFTSIVVPGGTLSLPTGASATLATTANLSSYLPLSGGTLTGALSGTSATFSGQLTTLGDIFITGASKSIVFNSAVNYNTQIYESSGALLFNTGGNTRLTIASGGAATFAGEATATNFSLSGRGTGFIFGMPDWRIYNDSSNQLIINNYTVDALTFSSSGNATFSNPLSVGTSNSITAGTIELGHASDTTISRVSAGVIAVEGVKVPAIAPSTSGNVMTSNGTDWVSSAPAASGSSFWTALAGATRVSNTTFTVTGDQTALIAKGMIIKWTESGTVRVAMVSIPSTFSSTTTVTIVGSTMASIDANSLKYAQIGAEVFQKNFALAGNIGATGSDVMNAYYATEPMNVLGADVQSGTAGTTNSTTYDINKNGTTMFTTKPTLASTVASSPTPFTADTATTLALGDRVSIDVDAVQTTKAIDGYIQLYVFPTRYLSMV